MDPAGIGVKEAYGVAALAEGDCGPAIFGLYSVL